MEYIVQNSMEQNGNMWNTLEATVSYNTRARLTPTLTHVVAYELATSGAERRRDVIVPNQPSSMPVV